MTALNIRGCRLVWSRLVDLGSIDPGSNPGSPTIPSKKGYCFLSFSLFRVSLAFLMLIQVNRDSKTQWSLGVLADKSVDKSSMAGNRCDNSYSPHSGFSEERVLKLIDESEIELAIRNSQKSPYQTLNSKSYPPQTRRPRLNPAALSRSVLQYNHLRDAG